MTKTQQPELPALSDDQERAEFERAFPECNFKRDRFGDYAQVRIQAAWIGWKRKAAVLADRERREPKNQKGDAVACSFCGKHSTDMPNKMLVIATDHGAICEGCHEIAGRVFKDAAPTKVEDKP